MLKLPMYIFAAIFFFYTCLLLLFKITVPGADELGERLSEILVRKKQFVASIMSLVDEYEFSIRR